MGSDEAAYRVTDHLTVEARDESDEVVLERIAKPLFDDVSIDTAFGTVAGMKVVVYELDALYPHGGRKLNVEHFAKAVQVAPKIGEIDMDYLMGSMDTAIGASGGFWRGGDFKPMQYGDEMPHHGVIGIGLLLRPHKR